MRTVHTLKYDQLRPSDAEALMGFHTDAGPSLQRIHPYSDSLPLQFKIQFFLTDLSEPDKPILCVDREVIGIITN